MIRDDLDLIKKNIENGELHRSIDEAYADGVWDYAIEYVRKHHSSIHLTDMEKVMQVEILYDFIYDLLDSELN